MPDADHSVAFWRSVGTTFRRDPGVLFELFNEPHAVTWSCWRSGCEMPGGWKAVGMQSLLQAVRSSGARQPVIVDGLKWANDLTGWISHPLIDPLHQLIAGFHVYPWNTCATPDCWTRQIDSLDKRVPVVTTEVGERDCRANFVLSYLDWAVKNRVSAMVWTWNTNQGCRALIRNYRSGAPSRFGEALRSFIRAHLAQIQMPHA